MKALLIPFGYPGYPEDIMLERIEESKRFLKSMDIDFDSTGNVIVLADCEQAISKVETTQFDYAVVLVATWLETPNVISVVSHIKHKPILLWSHGNMRSKGSSEVVSLGSIAAACVLRETFEELEYRFKFVIGNSYDKLLEKEMTAFHRAASTIAKMQKSRLGLAGYVSMGMQTGLADHLKVNKFFGTEIVHVDQYSVLNKLEETDARQTSPVVQELKGKWSIDKNVDGGLLEKTAAVYVRLKDLIKANKLDSLTVKCQYEMSIEYGFTPCVALSILGEEMPVCCEGDVPLLLSQMILNGLSGKTTTYGDVLEFLNDGFICAACGFAPRCFLKPERPSISRHTALYSGLLITSPFKEEKVTVIRLANDKYGFKLHLITGHVEELKDFHEIGCPQYAGSVIKFDNKTPENFIQEIMSQHYAIVFGDYEKELREFCRLMNIRIV